MEEVDGADGRMEQCGKEPCADGNEQQYAIDFLHRFKQSLRLRCSV